MEPRVCFKIYGKPAKRGTKRKVFGSAWLFLQQQGITSSCTFAGNHFQALFSAGRSGPGQEKRIMLLINNLTLISSRGPPTPMFYHKI